MSATKLGRIRPRGLAEVFSRWGKTNGAEGFQEILLACLIALGSLAENASKHKELE